MNSLESKATHKKVPPVRQHRRDGYIAGLERTMQEQYTHNRLLSARISAALGNVDHQFHLNDSELSDLELLSSAVIAAQVAIEQGLILGSLDELALRRAERAARLSDVRRAIKTVVASDGVA